MSKYADICVYVSICDTFVIPECDTKTKIMRYPTIRLVFDRKHVSSKKKKGLVQIEVCYERKRKWIGTGIKLYSDQWNDRKHVINSTFQFEWNDVLDAKVREIEAWIRENLPFEWQRFDEFIKAPGTSDDFREYVLDTINGRNDIRESTKKTHRKLVSVLKEYGEIRTFSDLIPANIISFDNWLHGRRIRKLDKEGNEKFVPMRQQTIFDFHKLLKIYIHKAIRQGLVKSDPYIGLRFKRGESEPERYVLESELRIIESSPMRSGSVARARDMFVFQCYTGLAYSDLKAFDVSKVGFEEGMAVYKGRRAKTDEKFCFVLVDKVKKIMEKYAGRLPVTSIENYNMNLKKVAEDAGIDKPLSSHWGRRTAAVMFANHHIPYEIVAKILGHGNVSTTAEFYARILDSSVIEAMKKARLE